MKRIIKIGIVLMVVSFMPFLGAMALDSANEIKTTPIAEVINKLIDAKKSGEGFDIKIVISFLCFLAVGWLKKSGNMMKGGKSYSLVFIVAAVGNYLFTGDPLFTSQFLSEVTSIALGAVGLHQGSKLLKGGKKK